jgi:serine/threonine protein kinase
MMGEVYSSKADVWSMGVVFYEMLFGVIPFPYKSIPEFLNLLKKQPISIPHSPKISPTCQQFLKEVLAANPDQRIGWEEMFSKYWVTEEGELMRKGEMTNT